MQVKDENGTTSKASNPGSSSAFGFTAEHEEVLLPAHVALPTMKMHNKVCLLSQSQLGQVRQTHKVYTFRCASCLMLTCKLLRFCKIYIATCCQK